MDPLTMGMISGGANLLGSVFSSITGASNVDKQMQMQQQMQQQSESFNAGQAQINRDYQTQMSNTAYQRASADMKAAGLNPMMMFGSGGAASSPSGSSASVGTPSVPTPQNTNPLAGIGDAVSKAVSTAIQAKTFDKMTDEVANIRSDTALQQARTNVTRQQEATAVEETKRTGAEADLATLRLPAARFSAKQAEDLLSMPEWLRSTVVQGGYLGGKISDAVAPLVSSATSAGRIGQAFSDIARSRSARKIGEGNFIGKYGVPIDEYLAQ